MQDLLLTLVSIAYTSCEHRFRDVGVTLVVKILDRGHVSTIGSGWRDVTDKA